MGDKLRDSSCGNSWGPPPFIGMRRILIAADADLIAPLQQAWACDADNVTTTSSAVDALVELQIDRFDLVVIGERLAGGTGDDFAEHVLARASEMIGRVVVAQNERLDDAAPSGVHGGAGEDLRLKTGNAG